MFDFDMIPSLADEADVAACTGHLSADGDREIVVYCDDAECEGE